jgi:plastocyanin
MHLILANVMPAALVALVALGGCFGDDGLGPEAEPDGEAATTGTTTSSSTPFPPTPTGTTTITITDTTTTASTTTHTGTERSRDFGNGTSGNGTFGNGTSGNGTFGNGTNGTGNQTNGTANGTAPRGPVTWNVTIGDGAFVPDNLTIQVNDTVRWTHNGSDAHTVTADDGSFDSSPDCGGLFDLFLAACMHSGDTFEWTFNATVEVGYHCEVDDGMHGNITVLARFDGRPE